MSEDPVADIATHLTGGCDHCGQRLRIVDASVHVALPGSYHRACIVEQLYPFDESLENREHELVGLEKLRAIRDRELAAKMHALWVNVPTRAAREVPKPEPVQPTLPLPAVDPVEEAEELERRYR